MAHPTSRLRAAGKSLTIFRGEPHPCPYLPERVATHEYVASPELCAPHYQQLMDLRFRRSGAIVYRTACAGCAECQPIRVPVERFAPSGSQRRVLRRDADVEVTVGPPLCDGQRLRLYQQYQAQVHEREDPINAREYLAFLCESPLQTLEIDYWIAARLIGVGIVDVAAAALSSVYFFYDPRYARRSLGVFSALHEIEECRRRGLPYWYAGYYVRGCRKMEYKAQFRPCEILRADGVWEALTG